MEDKDALKNIAANVNSLRTSAGFSKNKLAILSDTYAANISRIESAENMPGAALFFRIAKALGVTMDALIKTPERKKISRGA